MVHPPKLEPESVTHEAANGRFFCAPDCPGQTIQSYTEQFLGQYDALLPQGRGLVYQDEIPDKHGHASSVIFSRSGGARIWQLVELSAEGINRVTFTQSDKRPLMLVIDKYNTQGSHEFSRVLDNGDKNDGWYDICDYIKGKVNPQEVLVWWGRITCLLENTSFKERVERLYDRKRASAFALGKFATDRKLNYSVKSAESSKPESEAISSHIDQQGNKILIFETTLNGKKFDEELQKRQKLHDNVGFTALSPSKYKPRVVQLSLPGIFIRPSTQPPHKT